jgi:hypothetical protein
MTQTRIADLTQKLTAALAALHDLNVALGKLDGTAEMDIHGWTGCPPIIVPPTFMGACGDPITVGPLPPGPITVGQFRGTLEKIELWLKDIKTVTAGLDQNRELPHGGVTDGE